MLVARIVAGLRLGLVLLLVLRLLVLRLLAGLINTTSAQRGVVHLHLPENPGWDHNLAAASRRTVVDIEAACDASAPVTGWWRGGGEDTDLIVVALGRHGDGGREQSSDYTSSDFEDAKDKRWKQRRCGLVWLKGEVESGMRAEPSDDKL